MIDLKVGIIGIENLQRRLRDVEPKLVPKTKQAMAMAFAKGVRYVTQRHLSGGTSPTKLAVRTGHLRKSIGFKVETSQRTVYGEFGSFDSPYNEIHEKGGMVRATKPGGYLAIPLRAMKTARGVPRFTAGQLKDNPKIAGYNETFIHKGIIFGHRGSRKLKNGRMLGMIVPLFVLRKEVKIPRRPYIRPTFNKEIVPVLTTAMDNMVQGTIKAL